MAEPGLTRVAEEGVTIRLVEYVSGHVPRPELSEEEAKRLWRDFEKEITVEPPSFKTGDDWILRSEGWVGHIPLSPGKAISIAPKVPLANVFAMLVQAYDLDSFRFLPGLWESASMDELLDQLARELATRVLRRVTRGLYRSYVPRHEDLRSIRGTIALTEVARQPWHIAVPCSFEDHTPDVEENQILAWTLDRVGRTGFCQPETAARVRHAYQLLRGGVESKPFLASACVNRLYNRLNDDYEGLHAMCRFFLEQLGPAHSSGDRRALPFLLDMAGLYERFVARWLERNLPPGLNLKVQENVRIGDDERIKVSIDMVLYDSLAGRALSVLDTKYKAHGILANADFYQITAYANIKDCQDAILVYPVPLERNLSVTFGGITVRNLTFALDGNLEENGVSFVAGLLRGMRPEQTEPASANSPDPAGDERLRSRDSFRWRSDNPISKD